MLLGSGFVPIHRRFDYKRPWGLCARKCHPYARMPHIHPPRPVVCCLYEVDKSVVEYGQSLFDFVTFDDPRCKRWKEEAEGVMVRSQTITAADVAQFGAQLKFVQKHGVGVNALAVYEMQQRGITVMNTPGVNAGAVAELALALMMSLARNIPHIDRRIRAGEMVTKAEAGATGIQLRGRRFGIVGGGNIGYTLATMLCGAFAAEIYLYDPVMSESQVQRWSDLVPSSRFKRVDRVADMLPHVDFMSIHVPLLESTRDLLSEAELQLMQPHSILINTARGGVVNEAALLKALNEKWIAAAGIDAYVIEPPTTANYESLIAHDRVISLPHIGAASLDVIRMTAISCVEHLADAMIRGTTRDIVVV